MSTPIHRHLVEQQWREEGDLDLLVRFVLSSGACGLSINPVFQMERIYQMNVVPDMLPELKPTFDLRIKYAEAPPKDNYLRTRVKRKLKQVEPGIFLVAEQVCRMTWY